MLSECYYFVQYKQTPLRLASKEGHVDVANLLILHGADIQAKNWVSTLFYIINILYNLLYEHHNYYDIKKTL